MKSRSIFGYFFLSIAFLIARGERRQVYSLKHIRAVAWISFEIKQKQINNFHNIEIYDDEDKHRCVYVIRTRIFARYQTKAGMAKKKHTYTAKIDRKLNRKLIISETNNDNAFCICKTTISNSHISDSD